MYNKRRFYIIAIISTIGMLIWMTTVFFGGMYIYLRTYSLILVPIILLYNVSFVETFISVIRKGVRDNRVKVILHILVILSGWSILIFQSDLFKSKRVITATLKVDPFIYTVVFRANGVCESEAFSMLGYKEYKRGRYKFIGDTIVFKKKPADITFIPDTLLLDKSLQVIYYNRNQLGEFIKEIDWPDHFDVK